MIEAVRPRAGRPRFFLRGATMTATLRFGLAAVLAAILAAGCDSAGNPPTPPTPPTSSTQTTTPGRVQSPAPTPSAEGAVSTVDLFMGVPDDEWGDPISIPGGIIQKTSRVDQREYTEYLRAKDEKTIIKEMRCGRYQYWAVQNYLDVHFANPGPGEATSGMFMITARYKAEIPPGK
jgi:hypothetical protein